MPALEDLEKPLKGHGDKTKYILVGIGFLTLVVSYLIYRRNSQQSSTTTATAPSGVDPNTGIPYALEQAGGSTLGTGATGMGTQANDFSGLQSSLNDLAAQESALVTAITAPPQGTATQGVPPVDYSAFGPYANFIEQYIYQSPFGHPSNEAGLVDWENWIQGAVNSGMSVQDAENAAVGHLYASTPGLGTYKPPATLSGTTNQQGFYNGPLMEPPSTTTPPPIMQPLSKPTTGS